MADMRYKGVYSWLHPPHQNDFNMSSSHGKPALLSRLLAVMSTPESLFRRILDFLRKVIARCRKPFGAILVILRAFQRLVRPRAKPGGDEDDYDECQSERCRIQVVGVHPVHPAQPMAISSPIVCASALPSTAFPEMLRATDGSRGHPSSRAESVALDSIPQASRSTQELGSGAVTLAEHEARDIGRSPYRHSATSLHPVARSRASSLLSVNTPRLETSRGRLANQRSPGNFPAPPAPVLSSRQSSVGGGAPAPSMRVVSPNGGQYSTTTEGEEGARYFFPCATPWIDRYERKVAMYVLQSPFFHAFILFCIDQRSSPTL
jgi:hypothetical protein